MRVTKVLLAAITVFITFSAVDGLLTSSFAIANEETSAWLAAELPSVKNLKENIAAAEIPLYVDGGQECVVQKKFITRPAKKIFLQGEQSYSSCGVDTMFGTVDKTYRLTRLGTNIAGNLYDQNDSKLKLSPLPNSDDVLSLDFNAPSGAYIAIERSVSGRLTTQVDKLTGEVKHILANGSSQTVKNEHGDKLYGRLEARGVSNNGKWVVFDAVGIGLVRLNVDAGTILIFAPGYVYGAGQDPSAEYAVSNDGRYAVVSVFSPGVEFKIYDLDTCVKSSALDRPANCRFRDLGPVLQTAIPDHLGLGRKISFADDYSLKFYGKTLKNGVRTSYIQQLTATGHEPVEFPYLALGDSFASGEGAFAYKAGTDVKIPKNKCHISVSSYPFLIGKRLGLNRFQSIACSGAKIKDIDGQFLSDYSLDKRGRQSIGKETDGYDAEIYENFLPGYRMQKDFLPKYHPDKITISISGNDMGFGDIVRSCVWAGTCYSKAQDRAVLVKTINDRFPELVKMYQQLKQASASTDIYAIGYPKLVNPDGPCAANVHANHAELQFFNNLVVYMNSVIKKAADSAGVYYVDITDALDQHRLCETAVAEIAVNGLTAGNDKFFDIGPIGNESYHPNALGHELIEKSILEKTDGFSATNPMPKNVPAPTINDGHELIQYDDFVTPDANIFIKTFAASSRWNKDQEQTFAADGFQPDSKVRATLTSDPVPLGEFLADNNGEISGALKLPASVPVGYHTLHLAGKSVAGEDIEYQQQVFVTDADIISPVNNQNQNAIYVQPQQSAIGPQGQTSTIPETSLNSQASAGTQDILFGDTAGAGSLLNQPQVLGSASSPTTITQTNENQAPLQKSGDFPYGSVLVVLIVLLVVAGFLRLRAED